LQLNSLEKHSQPLRAHATLDIYLKKEIVGLACYNDKGD